MPTPRKPTAAKKSTPRNAPARKPTAASPAATPPAPPADTPPSPSAEPGASGERSLKLEIFLAIGLGLAAVVTATASFQSALVEDEMIAGFNRGIKAVDEAGQAFSEAQQIQSLDQALFIEYNKANFEEQYTLSTYILTSLMNPNLREAVEWWRDVAKDARTPFDEGSPYQLPALDRWESLKQEANEQFDAANEADETTDRYDFITVLAAVVLFFFGLASVVRSPGIRQTFSVMGAVILATSIVLLVLVETA